jgi:hypothetical protein
MTKKNPITRIYVSGYRWDVDFTRYCIASIREWNPDIPITMIKDRMYGDYYTGDIEKRWNVSQFDTSGRVFGWGFSKIEPLFQARRERFLVVDSDILFLGNIVESLEYYSEDFIVPGAVSQGQFQKTQYFDPDILKTLDPNYVHRGQGFNTGQWVGTSGIFCREDFVPFVEFTNPPRLRHPNIFQYGEQGLLNYFIYKQMFDGRITLASVPFMEIGTSSFDQVSINGGDIGSERVILVHWCGCRGKTPETSPNGHLFIFFAKRFYSRVPFGMTRKFLRDNRIFVSKYIRSKVKGFINAVRSVMLPAS